MYKLELPKSAKSGLTNDAFNETLRINDAA